MRSSSFDVAIIGAGTAGLAAFRAARAAGARALLIEGGPGGTTCAREGCMPSKLLIAAAEAAHRARVAGPFGIRVGSVEVDDRAVLARVRAERDRFVGFVKDGVDAIPRALRRDGYARFVGDGVLDVEGEQIEARSVVIATGSRPRPLRLLDGVRAHLMTSADVFELERLPRSVAVFGPGVIGLELGQALSRLGVRVRIFGVGGLLGPLTDPEVLAAGHAAFASELPMDTDARVLDVREIAGEVEIRFAAGGEVRAERFERVLSAIGRLPNLDRLGLERTTLPVDARGGLPVDPATLQVGDRPVFVAGDAAVDRPLLHEAADEGRIAGDNAARFPAVQAGLRRSAIAVVFSDPQIAMVGARYADLDPERIVVGAVDFGDQGRSRVMRENRGLLRVYADREDGRFRGAEMVGPRAEHLAHLLAWSHQGGLTVGEMLERPFYHPVVEEGLRTALRDAAARVGGRRAA